MKAANEAIEREQHITPTMDDVMYDLNKAQYFSKLDLNKGYHQFELESSSRAITTFSTHLGVFRYTRLSFGINAAAEIFQHSIQQTLQGLNGTMNVSDDILIYGKDKEEHDHALKQVLQRLKDTGLTLNKNKCKFRQTELKFLGHIFSENGIAPDPEKIEAIQTIQQPNNISEVRSFLGMTNFCTKFIPNLADIANPIRKLIKKNQAWEWGQQQEEAFKHIKTQLQKATNLAYFDKSKKTEVWVDASPTGLGAILIQRNQKEQGHILAFASHALNDTEQKYEHIEREALAIAWSIKHFHLYLFGQPFEVITDHQPLLSIFNKPNQELSPRLERWKLKLQPYNFNVTYKPGKSNPSDYMSRHPTLNHSNTNNKETLSEKYINYLIQTNKPKTVTIEEIINHTKQDITIQQVIDNIKTGIWTNNQEINEDQMKSYKHIKNELSITRQESILLRGTKIVIPQSLQSRIIQIAHASHQGINRTKNMIRDKIWFPGLDKLVERTIAKCLQCQAVTPETGKPELHPSPIPEGPWHTLNIDHKGPLPHGEHLLVITDQYSKFPLVEIVSSTSAKPNIKILKKIFSIFGNPRTIISDNGPPFNSQEFEEFLKSLNIKHHRITPKWPRANGAVERMNKTLSKILQIAFEFRKDWREEMQELLKDYRTTPHTITKVSPADLLFNYNAHTKLPDARHLNNPIDQYTVQQRLEENQGKMKYYYDQKHKLYKPNFSKGDRVLVERENKTKMNTYYDPNPYIIKEIQGSKITAEKNGHSITRNLSRFKKIEEEKVKQMEPNINEERIPEDNKGPHEYNLRTTRARPKRLIEE